MEQQREWARGRSWWVSAVKPQGGFVLMREEAVYRAWAALTDGRISLRDFRVWLATFEIQERRLACAAGRKPRYTYDEVHRLVGGVGGQHIRTSLRRLERAGLLRWGEGVFTVLGGRSAEELECSGRWVPVPRPLLRALVRATGRALLATAFGHLIRCLRYTGGRCVSGGYCKASWVSNSFSVTLRAVKSARKELIEKGFLRVLAADQMRLNRFGLPVVVNLSQLPTSGFAHPRPLPTTENAPPDQHKKLSYRRSEHQKPAPTADPTGVSTRRRISEPSLRDVKLEDLVNPTRLLSLFVQAEKAGLISRSEADKVAFLSTAEHAKRVGTSNVPGLFVSLVRERRYTYLSAEDEDRGRRVLADVRRLGLGLGLGRDCARASSQPADDRKGAERRVDMASARSVRDLVNRTVQNVGHYLAPQE